MKNILIRVIILILLSTQANGQQSQDNLYLKNGSKAVGKLLRKSETEYKFQTSDRLILTYSPDEVEKVVPAIVTPTNNTQDTIISNHNSGQSILSFSPTVLLNTPNGVQLAGGIKYQLFVGERLSMDADIVFSKDYFHFGPGLIGLPLLLLSGSESDDFESFGSFLFWLGAIALSFEHLSYHIPVNTDFDISPYVSVLRYKSSYEHNDISNPDFIGEQLSFAFGAQICKYFGRFVFSPYGEWNVGYKDFNSRFNLGIYLGVYFKRERQIL
jgi:hypothetical protein